MNVLFVCTGNTCRSPMAEALLKHHAPGFQVDSAGIYAAEGQSANPHAISVLSEMGIACDHTSKVVTEELLMWADLVLTMTQEHKQMLASVHPGFQYKIKTLIEFVADKDADNIDIADPFGSDMEVYRETCQALERSIKKLVKKLADE